MTSQLFSLPVNIPFKRIYSRMGQRVSTEISSEIKNKIDTAINDAFVICELKARYEIFNIERNDGENITFGGETFVSKSFCQLVKIVTKLHFLLLPSAINYRKNAKNLSITAKCLMR